jgi:hypothetical protein
MAGVYRSDASGTALILSFQARRVNALGEIHEQWLYRFGTSGARGSELYAGRWDRLGGSREERHGCRGRWRAHRRGGQARELFRLATIGKLRVLGSVPQAYA